MGTKGGERRAERVQVARGVLRPRQLKRLVELAGDDGLHAAAARAEAGEHAFEVRSGGERVGLDARIAARQPVELVDVLRRSVWETRAEVEGRLVPQERGQLDSHGVRRQSQAVKSFGTRSRDDVAPRRRYLLHEVAGERPALILARGRLGAVGRVEHDEDHGAGGSGPYHQRGLLEPPSKRRDVVALVRLTVREERVTQAPDRQLVRDLQ